MRAQPFSVLRQAVIDVAHGAVHAGKLIQDFVYTHADATTVLACVAALVARSSPLTRVSGAGAGATIAIGIAPPRQVRAAQQRFIGYSISHTSPDAPVRPRHRWSREVSLLA